MRTRENRVSVRWRSNRGKPTPGDVTWDLYRDTSPPVDTSDTAKRIATDLPAHGEVLDSRAPSGPSHYVIVERGAAQRAVARATAPPTGAKAMVRGIADTSNVKRGTV